MSLLCPVYSTPHLHPRVCSRVALVVDVADEVISVMQLLLAGLSFRAYRRERVVVPQQFDVEVTRTGSPPGYANSLSESLKDVLERDIVEDEEKKRSVKEVRWVKKETKRSVKV